MNQLHFVYAGGEPDLKARAWRDEIAVLVEEHRLDILRAEVAAAS